MVLLQQAQSNCRKKLLLPFCKRKKYGGKSFMYKMESNEPNIEP